MASSEAYSWPNTLAQKRTAASTCDCRNAPSPPLDAAQRVEQRAGTGVEKLLQLVEGALRNLVDGKLAGIVAARRDEADQRLGLAHLIGVEPGAGHDFLRRPRPDQAPHTPRHQLDLGSEHPWKHRRGAR